LHLLFEEAYYNTLGSFNWLDSRMLAGYVTVMSLLVLAAHALWRRRSHPKTCVGRRDTFAIVWRSARLFAVNVLLGLLVFTAFTTQDWTSQVWYSVALVWSTVRARTC
jgi:hypothetical protein